MSSMSTNLVLGPELNGTLMTAEEFDRVEDYDENYIYELIHGVLIVNPIPLATETGPNEELGYLLRSYQELHNQGSALDLTLIEQYVQTGANRRRADRVIWAGLGRIPAWRSELPTIVAEFVSRSARDRYRDYMEKRREYLRAGIIEYWIVDRFQRTLTVVRRQAKRSQEILVDEKDIYSTPLLPGFELPLARLLKVADMLNQPKEVLKQRPRRRL